MIRAFLFLVLLAGAAGAAWLFVAPRLTQEPATVPTETSVFDLQSSNRQARGDKLEIIGRSRIDDGIEIVSPVDVPLSDELPIDVPRLPLPRPDIDPGSNRNYSLVSNAQIAALKTRLKLTPAQSAHWPAVEKALQELALKVHDNRRLGASSGDIVIDPDGPEIAKLRAAARPLLATLREDQKREIRLLAHVIGLQAIASQI